MVVVAIHPGPTFFHLCSNFQAARTHTIQELCMLPRYPALSVDRGTIMILGLFSPCHSSLVLAGCRRATRQELFSPSFILLIIIIVSDIVKGRLETARRLIFHGIMHQAHALSRLNSSSPPAQVRHPAPANHFPSPPRNNGHYGTMDKQLFSIFQLVRCERLTSLHAAAGESVDLPLA